MPKFRLPDASGVEISSEDYEGLPAFVVAFFDNTSASCRRLHQAFADLCWELRQQGVGIVAVNPVSDESSESPAAMTETARAAGIMVPYLVDPGQRVARRFGVRRLPDFFVFDRKRRLRYHGRFDRSDAEPAVLPTGIDLRQAVRAVVAGDPVPRGLPGRGTSLAEPTGG